MAIIKDFRKNKNLSLISAKQEPIYDYPLTRGDLLVFQKCPLCQSRKVVPIVKLFLFNNLNFFSTSVCQNCRLVFRDISPSLQWFEKCWKIIKIKNPQPFNAETEVLREKEYTKYLKKVQKHKKSGDLLDIGAAWGTGSQIFQKQGFKVEAIEPEDNKFIHARKKFKLKVYASSLENLLQKKIITKKYDVIIFAHCIEHLDNPIKILPKLRQLLKKDGIIYLETPDVYKAVDWTDSFYLTHKFNFSDQTLSTLVKKSGLFILEKFKNKAAPQEPFHLGLILGKNIQKSLKTRPEFSVNKIKKLYQKGLALQIPTKQAVLQYHIEKIEQFYYTLRLNEKKLIYDAKSGSITLHPQ